ncbi:probable DNA metabolism protein [Mucilaginibacter lappiensis]|uniref:DNA metabolism protein n=1 Tax=Mucilaginibacter lappiensis TaxID=354630 RepID=A0ABR6PI35_9SPHI|nr:TIGR03915 family putative DNA repair protein [Mucilaginibacter lappiensis]MBB6109434.1 putative DNA metabolism protein [Mucilaginibacter lappiensis]SIQ95625.1 probable DNA metabolism protein [Mucilaginibacter lappiensis]
MYSLIYDGTFEGLLTAVFEIYDRKLLHVKLIKGEWRSSALFEEVLQIITDENRANRVLKGLCKKLSAAGLQRLYIAHMAEMANEESAIVGFIRYVFDTDQNVEEDYGNKYVMRISEIIKMVRREKHRMEAFVRFQKLKDETFYSAVEPDFNVLPLLIRHFKNRYTDQKWIIYDIKRGYGLYYDLHDIQYISLDFSEVNNPTNVITAFSDDESIYQHLWKNYFTSVNIVSRKNTRLHLRHIPKRYWKHLTEKI